ncbi:hypothetical protein AYO38_03325 [bacterium SCGC AG-212-C10]|nr:hypothetical protein AYO38_03325 [bacterium SCGC AG-212-C10]
MTTLDDLASGPPLDAVIVGGGINGAAITAETSRRGLRVALFEADDYGFGTTWRSTKLIHGGLRYLEHGDVRLVFESLRERAWLLRAKPHLVRPRRFILPLVPWTRRPAWQLRAGLAMYDTLAFRGSLPAHRRLSANDVRNLAPYVGETEGGGFSFYDARALSPERLTLELVLLAERRGAFIANHTPVTRIITSAGEVAAVEVDDGRRRVIVPTSTVINAAGPWVDAVNEVSDQPPTKFLGATRGTHIALELETALPKEAIFSTAREDGRVLFAVPQEGLLLFGTTDVRFDLEPGEVRPTPEDIDYLVTEARLLLPGLGIDHRSIRYSYAGLRPLQRATGRSEAEISRRHSLIDHGATGGARGVYSVIGGKLSTFRPLAREVADEVEASLPEIEGDLPEVERPLASRAAGEWQDALNTSGLELHTRARLAVYGPALPAILASGKAALCDSCGTLEGEVQNAIDNEHAVTIGDVILRRTGAGWRKDRGLCCHERIGVAMARALGWSQVQLRAQVEAFRAEVDYHLPAPGAE